MAVPPAAHAQTKPRRLDFLDSLRGLAALYVILYHTALIPQPALHVPVWAAPVVLTGGTGVTLFFVASAFSLCWAMRGHARESRPLLFYAIRRIFRIAPLFYAAIVFYLVRDQWYFGVSHSPLEVLVNALFLFNAWPGHETGIVWASWTIGVEMPFYLLFPFVAARSKTVGQAASLVLLSLLAAPLFGQLLHLTSLPPPLLDSLLHYSVVPNLPIFSFGILAFRIFERWIEGQDHERSVGVALFLGSIYLYANLLRGTLTQGFLDPGDWQSVVYALLLLALAVAPLGIVVNRATHFFGKLSYSMYLVHPSVVLFMVPLYRRIEQQGWQHTVSFALIATITIAAVTAISVVTHRTIERPGIAAGQLLIEALKARSRPSAALNPADRLAEGASWSGRR